jgi:hypothetical protein
MAFQSGVTVEGSGPHSVLTWLVAVVLVSCIGLFAGMLAVEVWRSVQFARRVATVVRKASVTSGPRRSSTRASTGWIVTNPLKKPEVGPVDTASGSLSSHDPSGGPGGHAAPGTGGGSAGRADGGVAPPVLSLVTNSPSGDRGVDRASVLGGPQGNSRPAPPPPSNSDLGPTASAASSALTKQWGSRRRRPPPPPPPLHDHEAGPNGGTHYPAVTVVTVTHDGGGPSDDAMRVAQADSRLRPTRLPGVDPPAGDTIGSQGWGPGGGSQRHSRITSMLRRGDTHGAGSSGASPSLPPPE